MLMGGEGGLGEYEERAKLEKSLCNSCDEKDRKRTRKRKSEVSI